MTSRRMFAAAVYLPLSPSPKALLEKMCDCHLGSSVPCTGQPALRSGVEGRREREGQEEDSPEEDDVDIMDKDVVQVATE